MKIKLVEDILKVVLCDCYFEANRFQKLIDKWNDPEDIAQRAAVMLQKVHQKYAKIIFMTLQELEEKSFCKHPKKMRDLCADGTIYCMDCNGDLTEKEIMSVKTPTLMKQKVLSRRNLVKKYTKQKMKQNQIAKKLDVSLSTIEKDISVLRL